MIKTHYFFFVGLLTLVMDSGFAADWQHTNGLIGQRVNALAACGTELFAGTGDSGVFRSVDSGMNWLSTNTGLTDFTIRALVVRGTYLFAGTQDSGVFRSGDSGASWQGVNAGMSSTNIQALAVNDTYIFAGTDGGGVCRSSDNGTHWMAVNKLDDGTDLHFKSIYSFGISKTLIFIGTWGGSAFRSADNGMTWYLVTNGMADPRENIIPYSFVAADTFIFAGTRGGGIFRAKDSATVWFPVNAGLPDSALVTALALYRDTLFAATQKGIYHSADNGDNWVPDSNGFSENIVNSFAVNSSTIFAGTNGGGVWRSPFYSTTILSVPLPVVTLPYVNDTLTTDRVLCKWNTVNLPVIKYQLQVYSDRLLTELVISDSTIVDTAFTLKNLSNNQTYWWRVRACNAAGWGLFSNANQIIIRIPPVAVFPSSFTIDLKGMIVKKDCIRYGIPQQCLVTLAAYDIRGRLVRIVVASPQTSGYHVVNLNQKSFPTGRYLLRFVAGTYERVVPFFKYR